MRAVLTYHSIDASGSPVSVSPELFRAHVRWLVSGRVRVVPLAELIDVNPVEDAVSLTFDDALVTFGDLGAPLLAELGLPVTTFVVSDRVGLTNAWSGQVADRSVPTLELMDWRRLKALVRLGVEMGAHTRTHPDLTRVDDGRLEDEIMGSAERIETELGRRPRCFAYPYGALDERAVAWARKTYQVAVTTEFAPLPGAGIDRHRVPRLDMVYFRDPRRLESWGSRGFKAYLALRRAGRRVRAGLTSALENSP